MKIPVVSDLGSKCHLAPPAWWDIKMSQIQAGFYGKQIILTRVTQFKKGIAITFQNIFTRQDTGPLIVTLHLKNNYEDTTFVITYSSDKNCVPKWIVITSHLFGVQILAQDQDDTITHWGNNPNVQLYYKSSLA